MEGAAFAGPVSGPPDAEGGGLLAGAASGGDGARPGAGGGGKLGTFFGVFCPVAVSMFSTLLFLRPGFIVANLGLLGSLLALLLAYVLLGLTVQSLSAIVTNGDVRGGGVYFMLSRCLGPEIGGTIGMVFYAANVVGSALYACGSSEGILALGLHDLFGTEREFQYFLASSCNVASLLVCLLGAELFGGVSSLVMVSIVTVLGELCYNFWWSPYPVLMTFNVTTVPHCEVNCTYEIVNGTFQSLSQWGVHGVETNLADNFYPNALYDCENPEIAVTAKTAFAVLFSGVTGIMAGANLSGELMSPSKSIPRGTYLGIVFTFVIYCSLFVLTAATCTRDLIYHECHYLSLFSTPNWLVSAGALVTTFCAATSGMLGASQLLQAVAMDNLLPRFLTVPLKWGVFGGRPVMAYLISFIIVQIVLLIKSLNQIARLCTICYLLSYGFVNVACVLLDWSAAINFRPTMGIHWSVSLVAVILCMLGMAAVSLLYSLMGFFVTLAFGACVIFGTRHGEPKNWGSVQQGILYHQVRKYLLLLDSRKYHVKFWRPQILLLVHDPLVSANAIKLGNNLKKGGLYVLGHVFKGDVDSLREWETCPTMGTPQPWLNMVDRLGVKAFHNLTVAQTLRGGVQQLVRLSGIGAMRPNIIMMGFKRYIDEAEVGSSKSSQNERGEATPPDSLANADDELVPWNTEGFSVSTEEYCNIIRDMARFHKSVVLHRNVGELNGEPWMRKNLLGRRVPKPDKTLDVWLVDFLSPPNAVVDDFSCMLMLQLAFIASNKLGGLPVRAFLRSTDDQVIDDDILAKFQKLIKQQRLQKVVSKTTVLNLTLPSSSSDTNGQDAWGLGKMSLSQMSAVNEQVRAAGGDSSVVSIFYLQPPPAAGGGLDTAYLQLLRGLTTKAGPCLFVRAEESVITTEL